MSEKEKDRIKIIIRRMVVACTISEYALIELKDNVSQDLKQRTNAAIKSINRVQDYFIHASMEHNETFKKEFLKGQIVLMGELIESVWGLSEDDIETIINAVKANTSEAKLENEYNQESATTA